MHKEPIPKGFNSGKIKGVVFGALISSVSAVFAMYSHVPKVCGPTRDFCDFAFSTHQPLC